MRRVSVCPSVGPGRHLLLVWHVHTLTLINPLLAEHPPVLVQTEQLFISAVCFHQPVNGLTKTAGVTGEISPAHWLICQSATSRTRVLTSHAKTNI